MEKELISIITPTYNREKTLIRVYDSLCKQSYKCIEWIVVDDGSRDKTKELILSLINQKNKPLVYLSDYTPKPSLRHKLQRCVWQLYLLVWF